MGNLTPSQQPPIIGVIEYLTQVTQSYATPTVDGCVKTTLVIVQWDQAYALGYIPKERLEYCGHRVGIYSYAHHVKIYQQPSRPLKSCPEACLRKAMKNP